MSERLKQVKKESPDPYEPLIKHNGTFVRQSQLPSVESGEKIVHLPSNEKSEQNDPIDHDRRRFLQGVVAGGVLGAIGLNTLRTESESTSMIEDLDDAPFEPLVPEIETEKESIEKVPDATIEEQLKQFGYIKDLREALRAHERDHQKSFIETEIGKRDLETAVANIKKLNMEKLMEPFTKHKLPEDLAYMIAIQETRGENVVSHAGALGITGIMPQTARSFGKEPEALEDPYVATAMSADFLKREIPAFGRNIPMLLHVYNGGAGLMGFTEVYPKEKWKPKYFYEYMQSHINKKYRELKENAVTYKIQKGDTIDSISKACNVSMETLLKHNNLEKGDTIIAGRSLKIPITNIEEIIRVGLRKELELIRYVPEIRAKYSALKALNLVTDLEEGVKKRISAFG